MHTGEAVASLPAAKMLITNHKPKDLAASFVQDLRGKPHYSPHLMPSSPVIFSLCH